MAKIFVTDGAGGNPVPFLRGILTRSLNESGLPFERAYEVASEIRGKLNADQSREISARALRDLTEECLSEHFGPRAVERYRVWMDFSQSGRPLILLIGGTTGSGKSTVATELAHRLSIVRTQSTDMLREVMRMLIPRRLLPVLHHSSFEAWTALTAMSGEDSDPDDLLAAGYLRQAELLAVPCEAVIQRAVRERVSLILEGVHVHPTLLESIGEVSDAVVVPVMLGVLKPEELRSRLSGRLLDAPERSGKAHLSNNERIWRLQAYLLSEADRAGIPIVINEDKEKATDLVLRTVVDVLASGGAWRGCKD